MLKGFDVNDFVFIRIKLQQLCIVQWFYKRVLNVRRHSGTPVVIIVNKIINYYTIYFKVVTTTTKQN